MAESSPYSAPHAVGQTDEDLVRSAKEPVRTGIFTAAFVLVVYRLTSRTPKALSSAYTAGATTCPSCGSVQTDQDYTRGPDGNEVLRWTCYACDHRWLAS